MDAHPMGQVGYITAAALLRARILTGVYPPGTQLPSEKVLSDELDCGLDTVKDALRELRRELLTYTRRGYRSVVCSPPEREAIALAPGERVTAWMLTLPEAAAFDLRPEMPVLCMTDAEGTVVRYAADQVQLVVPAAPTAGHWLTSDLAPIRSSEDARPQLTPNPKPQ